MSRATFGGTPDYERELEALRAKLAEVEGERDEARQDFGGYDERCEFLQGEYSKVLRELEVVTAERDAARRWAGVWKQSAQFWRNYVRGYFGWSWVGEIYRAFKNGVADV